MRHQPNEDFSSFFHRLVDRLFRRQGRKAARRTAARVRTRRRMHFEQLEGRQLLASDLASITGIVSLGSPVDGATIELYRDLDTDGLFEPGGDDGAALATVSTDATGAYRFDGLEAGDYFVHQPAQTVGAIDLGQFVSSPITITAGDAQGVAGMVVDDFDDLIAQLVTATDSMPDQSGTADHAGALGGERDMRVEFLSGGAADSVSLQSTAATLTFNSSLTAQGRFTLVYDGDDNDATTVSFMGLGGEDLTQGGATLLQVRVQADQPDATLRLRVYTDADNFSETAAFTIPGTNTPTDALFEFTSFVQGGGATGPADFANVGAIEMIVETATDGTDGLVTLLGAFGPTIIPLNIANEADLALDKDTSNATPNLGEDVTFTLTLTNPSGGAGATNVAVTDLLPAGLTFVSDTPSQGSYDSATGLWTVGDVAAGDTATLTIVATLTATGVIANDAQITAVDQPDPDANNNLDSVALNVPAAADLRLSKDVDDATPNPNQVVEFTLTVTNDGPDQATGVVATDQLPAGLTFQSATPSQGSYDDVTGVWTVGTIDNGNNATLVIQAQVTSNDPITNVAEITASDQFDIDSTPGDGEPDDDDYAEVTIDVPPIIDLELDKTVDNATPNVGESITFTITLTNQGPEDAPGVIVTDVLPAGLAFDSAAPSQGTYDESTGEWNVGTVAVSQVITLVINAVVTASGTLTNAAEVTACGGIDVDSTHGDGQGDDFDEINVVVPPAADLSLTKDVDVAAPSLNQQVVFTLTLTNDGPDDATGVVVTDLLPAGLTFVGATPSQGTYDDATGIWNVGAVNNGASATLAITVVVATLAPATNTAEVTASDLFDPDSTPDNNEAGEDDQASITVDAIAADLELTKTVDNATPNFGQTITFTLTLDNLGPDDATGVGVTDLLPAGLTFQSATPSQGAYDDATGVWLVGTVPASGSATLDIVVLVNATGAIVNDAEVTASDVDDPDSTPGDGEGDDFAAVQLDVPAAADLSLTKEIDDDSPLLGQDVTFTLTVTNGGPDDATGVVVVDQLSAGLTFVSANASQGSYDDATGVWTVGTIANSNSATLTITATVTVTTPVTNTGEITDSDQFDPDSTPGNNEPGEDDQDSVTIDVLAADLELSKIVDDATPNFGQTVTFTLTLDNLGPDEATGVEVTDLLPAGLTFQSATPSQGTYDDATGVWLVGTVAASGNATLEIVAVVNATGVIVNDAEVTASDVGDPDSTPGDGDGDDFAMVQLDVPAAADLSLTKTVDNNLPLAGQNVTFTLTVANAGPDQATGVVVLDQLPAGLTFVSANASQGSYDDATGVWIVGTIDNGNSATLEITATVTVATPVTNTGEITDSDQFDPDSTPGNNDPEEDDQDSVTVDVPESADLELTKTVDDSTPNVGQTVTFTLTLANQGPDSAVGVEVTDVLPVGLSFQSATPSQGSYDDATGVWTVGTVTASSSVTLVIEALVTASGTIINPAEVTASPVPDPDSTPGDGEGDDFDAVTLNIQAAADLSLTKDVNDTTPNFGDDVTFTITLTNDGPDEATGVVVTDQLPAGLTFQSATPSGSTTYDSGTGIWTVGTLASGTTATLVIVAEVTGTGQLVNAAEVTASDQFDPDSTPGDGQGDDFDQATVDVVATADLSLTKTVNSATPNFGSNVTFTLTLLNSGPNDATSVEVTDLLPAGLAFQSATPSQGTYDETTGIWDVGALANGASVTLVLVAQVNSPAALTNTAEVTASDQFDPDSTPGDGQGDDFASVTIDAPAAADLSLTKTVNNATPNFGSDVTFTVTLTNSGPDTATNVVVADSLPGGLVLQSSNAAGGTAFNSATGQWTIPSLASGASVVLTLVARINSTAALTNTAEVIASDQFDPDSTPGDGQGDDFASATVDAPSAADLRLAKTASATTVVTGQQVTFTVTVTNDGPDQATGVEVTDLLPAGLDFVGSTQSQGAYNSTTGVWTVGTLDSGATATLTITATVTATDPVTNVAEVSASNQFDPDSTPGNNAPGEDDRDTETITPTTATPARLSKRMFLAR